MDNRKGIGATGVLLMALICCAAPMAHAQDTVGDIVRKLNSRSMSVEPIESKLEQIKEQQDSGRPLSNQDLQELGKAAENAEGKLDVAVLFAYNSDQLLPESIPILTKLGQALASDELKAGKFLINGHTDARGGRGYNLALSQRRALAVRAFLIKNFGIDAARLTAIGFGQEHPRNLQDPFAAENRRVQIVNASK